MIQRLKTICFFAAGIGVLLDINFLFDKFDEVTERSVYERERGPGYERFVDSAKATCITHHKAKEPPIDKTDAQIAAYCVLCERSRVVRD